MDTTRALRTIGTLAATPVLQADAAELLGISRRSTVRREREGWPLEELLRIADAYNVSRTAILLKVGALDAADVRATSDALPTAVSNADLLRKLAALEERLDKFG